MRSIKAILFQYLFAATLIIALVAIGNDWLQYSSLVKYIEKVETNKASVLARNLEATLIFESQDDFNNLIKSSDDLGISVYNAQNELVFSHGDKIKYNTYADHITWGDGYIITKTNIVNGTEKLGTLIIKSSTTEITNLTKATIYYLLGSIFLVIIVFMGMLFLLDKNIAVPISNFSSKIKEILNSNDLSIRLTPTEKNKEIQELASSFNSLLLNLEVNNERLKDLNANLEIKVDEKTKKLKLALEDLMKYQKQVIAQEKLASLGSLAAGIAHEIKNPINLINNSAIIISEHVNNSLQETMEKIKSGDYTDEDIEDVYDYIKDLNTASKIIVNSGKRADSIIKSMLLLSRSQKSTEEVVSLSYHLDTSLNLSFHAMRAKPGSIEVEIRKEIEKTPLTKCYPQDIERALVNIFDNAFYAMKKKKKDIGDSYSPCLIVTSKQVDEAIWISIQDNGLGINEDVKNKILEPFYTTKPTGEGTGLGMSMVNDIIIAHKGELDIESVEGEFTKINIKLPIIRA